MNKHNHSTSIQKPLHLSHGTASSIIHAPQAPKSSTFTNMSDTIDAIVQAAEARQLTTEAAHAPLNAAAAAAASDQAHHRTQKRYDNGPLTSSELDQIGSVVYASSSERFRRGRGSDTSSSWQTSSTGSGGADVTPASIASSQESYNESLAALVPLLEQHVVLGSQVMYVKRAVDYISQQRASHNSGLDQWLHPVKGEGETFFLRMKQGLESASLLLSIMTMDNVDRKFISEDAIEVSIVFMKHMLGQIHTSASIVDRGAPASITSGRRTSFSSPKRSRNNQNDAATANSTWTKMQSNQYKNKIHKRLFELVPHITTLMMRIRDLLQLVALDDRQIPLIALACMQTLTFPLGGGCNSSEAFASSAIRLESIELVSEIFRSCPRYRPIIVEDIFPILLQLPTLKKSRSYPVKCPPELWSGSRCPKSVINNDNNTVRHIQYVTYFLIRIVEASIYLPTLNVVTREQHGKQKKSLEPISGIDQATQHCYSFVSQLLSRCNTKNEDGGASEFRPVLNSIVDDLLAIHLSPQYPTAGFLLASISKCISSQLAVHIGNSSQKYKLETTYLNTALDTLGKIGACAARHLSARRNLPYTLPDPRVSFNPNATATDENERMACVCGNNSRDRFCLDCDICHTWFHGSCVGIRKDACPEVWHCHGCRMRQCVSKARQLLLEAQTGPGGNSSCTSPSILNEDNKWVYRQLMLDHCSLMITSPSARNAHIACWGQEFFDDIEEHNSKEAVALFRHFVGYWDKESANHAHDSSDNTIPFEHQLKITFETALSSMELYCSSFSSILSILVRCMCFDKSIGLKKAAVKAAHIVVESDPKLLTTFPTLRRAINDLLCSAYTSVRDATVNLVGMYTSSTNQFGVYLNPLLLRLGDDGVSVRRRVVKILADGMNLLDESRSALACQKLLCCASNPKEEETVKDTIFDFFSDRWFACSADESSKATKHAKMSAEIVRSVSSDFTMGNNNDAISILKNGNDITNFVVEVISSLTSGYGRESDSNNKIEERSKRKAEMMSNCQRIVSALLEHLLIAEEKQSRPTTHDTHQQLVPAQILIAIDMFSRAQPTLISIDILDVLLPYLKPDGTRASKGKSNFDIGTFNAVGYAVLSCLNRSLPNMEAAKANEISSFVLSDLSNLCYKGIGESIVSKSVETLCNLELFGNNSDVSRKIFELEGTFYKYSMNKLQAYQKNPSVVMKPAIINNVDRSLAILGCICRFQDTLSNKDEKNRRIAKCYELFKTFISYHNKAVKACTSVWIRCPDILLSAEREGLLISLLSNKDDEIILQTLRGLLQILTAEEWLHSHRAKSNSKTSGKSLVEKVSGDQDAEASLVGSILTQHASTVLGLTQHVQQQVRLSATRLVGQLLDLGLMNPMEALPFLIALQGDIKCHICREVAKKALLSEGERRPDSLKTRIPHGIRRAFELQRMIMEPQSTQNITALMSLGKEGIRCVFQEIFIESINKSRAQRQAVYKSLMTVFANVLGMDNSQSITVGYTAELMSPTRSPGKHHIRSASKSSSKRRRKKSGENVLGSPKKKSKKKSEHDVFSELALCAFTAQILAHLEYNEMIDPLFIIHYLVQPYVEVRGDSLLNMLTKIVCKGGEDDNCNGDEDEVELMVNSFSKRSGKDKKLVETLFCNESFEELVLQAGAIVLLLRLKSFLMKVYSISETKLNEYAKSEGPSAVKEKCCVSNKFIIFNHSLPILKSSNHQNGSEKDRSRHSMNVLEQYAEFRSLMRIEMCQTCTNIKDDDEDKDHKVLDEQ